MKVTIHSEKELYDLAAELIHVVVNLRHYEKKWSEVGGALLRQQVKEWQEKADTIIERYRVEKTTMAKQIKFETNA